MTKANALDNQATPFRPALDWSGFLESAPYFISALTELVELDRALNLAPLPRAAWYFDIFNAELSNGGVMQYFYNQATRLPGFDRIPEFIAEHPMLADALPFVQKVHAAWEAAAPAVHEARESDDWPEDLFKDYEAQFDALVTEFFAVNDGMSRRLEGAMVQAPQDYFDMTAVPDLPANGIAHIVLNGGKHRLRFHDGFPVGPNLLENEDGTCDVVWFTHDRKVLEVDKGNRSRSWIHYPSLASSSLDFKAGRLESFTTERAMWHHHGIHQYFREDGSVRSTHFKRLGDSLLNEYHYPSGQTSRQTAPSPEGKRSTSYWPCGGLNTVAIEIGESADTCQRFLTCLAEDGTELSPGGNGLLLMVLSEEDGKRCWLEGRLVDGLMEGQVMQVEKNLVTGEQTEQPHARYEKGREQ